MSIRVLSLDYDGCLFHPDFINSDDKNVITHNRIFLDGIIGENTDIDQTILLSGSNRQSYLVEYMNSGGKPELSSFTAAKQIADYLAPATMDTFLLSDIYGDLPYGTSYARALDKEYKDEHTDWLFDETKATVLYAQMHKIAMENPYEDIIFDFYDDRQDILNELARFFGNHDTLVPNNIILRLNQYAGKEVTKITSIEGQGFIDTNFKQTVKDMASLTIEKHPERDGLSKPVYTSRVVTPEILLNRVALIPDAAELDGMLDKLKDLSAADLTNSQESSDNAEKSEAEDQDNDLKKSQDIAADAKQSDTAEPEDKESQSDKPADIIVEDKSMDLNKSQDNTDDLENELQAENPEEFKKGDSEQPDLHAEKENKIDETQNHFHEELKVFKTKTEKWLLEVEEPTNTPEKRAMYDAAYKAASEMHEKIENGAKEFFIDPNDQNRKDVFRQVCTDAIAAARPELEKHRVLNKAWANVALAIVTLGIGFVFAGLINLAVTKGKHFLFFTTNSEKRLDALEYDVERMTAPAA